MKIYISGQITGIEDQAPGLFKKAEEYLISQGYDVVNPMELVHGHDKEWLSYMQEDIEAMMTCRTIYMLKNWTNTLSGANIERDLAIALGYNIIYE